MSEKDLEYHRFYYHANLSVPKGPIIYYVPGGGGLGGYNFWKGLILGGQFWKCKKCRGGGSKF